MKKSHLLFLCIAFSVTLIRAQVPQAFKYQAVIRDANGVYMADKDVSLKINIVSGNPDGDVVYSEIHSVHTNNLGLVNLEIGRGASPTTGFSKINWALGTFYVSIELDEKGGQNFHPMGISQLLAVPYALHSETSSGLVNENGMEMTNDPGVPAHAWSLFGNSSSSSPDDKLGTTDEADLMVVTNNVERMRIFAEGDIDVARSMTVGENLVVKQNVNLNTIGGETDNHGPFTVSELSPTLLSGTLTVDGATDLNNTLNVDGITDLNSNLNVNNHAPSKLTGSLWVQHDATFDSLVKVHAKRDSYNAAMGALVIDGGLGVGNNLTVGDTANFQGPLMVKNTNNSFSPYNGALVVAGGVGIGKRLNVAGRVQMDSVVQVNNQMTITANPGDHTKGNYNNYPLRVDGGDQGIAVKINGSSDNTHNYMVFYTSDNQVRGRIEGQTESNLESDDDYKMEKRFKITDMVLNGADYGIALAEILQAMFGTTAAATSSTGCAGLGVCVTAPIPSLIACSATELILKIANAAVSAGNFIRSGEDYDFFINTKLQNLGVSYQSGAADYAEWLPKENQSDTFKPGELVGIKNGIVTKNIFSADQIMVVSTNPVVLGNMPPAMEEKNYVKIAFMGQVPVFVIGTVNPGDYILPSEINNGFGKAVHPKDMKISDYKHIAGVAWSDIRNINAGLNQVNVAVGINANDLTDVLYRQEEKLNALLSQVDKSNDVLARLVPGYAEAIGLSTSGRNNDAKPVQSKSSYKIVQSDILPQTPEDIIYFEFSKEEIGSALDMAKENYAHSLQQNSDMLKMILPDQEYPKDSKGNALVPIEDHPFWKRIDSEPGYREAIIQLVKDNLEKSVYTQRKYLDNFTGMKIKE